MQPSGKLFFPLKDGSEMKSFKWSDELRKAIDARIVRLLFAILALTIPAEIPRRRCDHGALA